MDTQKYIKPREKEGHALQLSIPDSVAQAIRLPEKYREQNLLIELAVALYAQEALSFGKARELAGMSTYEFSQLLGRREIPRHYGASELEDDLRYARGESSIAGREGG